MTATTAGFSLTRVPCYYRPLILATAGLAFVCLFWFGSRYPQLLHKVEQVGQALPSAAYTSEVIHVAAGAPLWLRILGGAGNWLSSMRVGMTFGVLFGALLHTVLHYYPMKIGANLYLNSLKGALVGVPMGVCANCAVPAACGLTRGRGRVEVALGFLFSSPNFNPVVMMMTFSALPWTMSVTKYALLLIVILVVVPSLIRWLERDAPLKVFTASDEMGSCSLTPPSPDCDERFIAVLKELAVDYGRHVWMLLKPTLTIMLLASLAASALLTLVPWNSLLSEATPLKLAYASLVSVFTPVPIALDVLFAAQLQQQGSPAGFVMLFAMTLGTYSIIPSIYLWREVSKKLAVILFLFFLITGWILGMLF